MILLDVRDMMCGIEGLQDNNDKIKEVIVWRRGQCACVRENILG